MGHLNSTHSSSNKAPLSIPAGVVSKAAESQDFHCCPEIMRPPFYGVSSGHMGNNNKAVLPLPARAIYIGGCVMGSKPPTPAQQSLGAPFLSSVNRDQIVNLDFYPNLEATRQCPSLPLPGIRRAS